MSASYLLAKDYLERAMVVLHGSDKRSRQLRIILERTIELLEDSMPPAEAPRADNVVDLSALRAQRLQAGGAKPLA